MGTRVAKAGRQRKTNDGASPPGAGLPTGLWLGRTGHGLRQGLHHSTLLIEVISPSPERVDPREKFSAYTTIESLEEYVLIAQSPPEVTVYRRADGWRAVEASGLEARLALESLSAEVPLATVYEGLWASAATGTPGLRCRRWGETPASPDLAERRHHTPAPEN